MLRSFRKGPHGGVKRTVNLRWIGPGRVLLLISHARKNTIQFQLFGWSLPRRASDAQSFLSEPCRNESKLTKKQPVPSIATSGSSFPTLLFPSGGMSTSSTGSLRMERQRIDLPELPPDAASGHSSSRSSSRFPGVPYYYAPDFSKIGPHGSMPPINSGEKKPNDVFE